jgi:hypothetical protein
MTMLTLDEVLALALAHTDVGGPERGSKKAMKKATKK